MLVGLFVSQNIESQCKALTATWNSLVCWKTLILKAFNRLRIPDGDSTFTFLMETRPCDNVLIKSCKYYTVIKNTQHKLLCIRAVSHSPILVITFSSVTQPIPWNVDRFQSVGRLRIDHPMYTHKSLWNYDTENHTENLD